MSVTLSNLIKTNLRYILKERSTLSGGPWKCKPHAEASEDSYGSSFISPISTSAGRKDRTARATEEHRSRHGTAQREEDRSPSCLPVTSTLALRISAPSW